MMLSTELEAGPELDAAVAKAIGFDLPIYQHSECVACSREFGWHPSTDLNAAFEAAERFIARRGTDYHGRPWQKKLFDRNILSHCDGKWSVDQPGCGEFDSIAEGPTPAVAICRAIIKLAETKQEAQ